MSVQITLEPLKERCSFAPLAVVGYCLTRRAVLQPLWAPLQLDLKVYDHKVALLETHPYAEVMCVCLHKLLQTFDLT